ncbi:hypothetical protein Gotur_032499, partial [Gossypium turneri]
FHSLPILHATVITPLFHSLVHRLLIPCLFHSLLIPSTAVIGIQGWGL